MAFYLLPKKKRVSKSEPLLDHNGNELRDYENMIIQSTSFEERWFWLWFSWKTK